jgi:hypothetical protein
VDLDFLSIKNSLKNFLRDNPQFQDYDYEGSNINMLLELLAINGYRTAFYQNMLLNESFLDSAQLRNSVLSRAKELNYLPKSAKSARARVKVSFDASGASAPYTIAKGSLLASSVKNDTFTFTIPSTLVVASANSTYEFETDVYEGYYVQDTYTYASGTTGQSFQITNRDVDTDSLTVTVYEDGNTAGVTYVRANSLLDLDNTSEVYFIEPTGVGYYNILFGDNNIGKRPKGDSTIVLNYRVTQGSDGNGARIFTLEFDPTGADELTSAVTVNTLQSSIDGVEEESLDSIKYNAPRHFQVQERAVTATDYSSILKSQFPEIRAIYAYGGEELQPPIYGRVYISVDISDVDGLPDSKIEQYRNFLKNRTTFGIVPFFTEPSYTYIKVDTKVRYNINITTKSQETISAIVRDAVVQFRDDNLDDFNVIFRASRLETEIDASDPSIISSITDLQIYKKTNPTIGELVNIDLDFGTKLRTDLLAEKEDRHRADIISALQSSNFYYKSELCTMDDDGAGKVRIMKIVGGNHERVTDIGTIDYNTGAIRIRDIKIDSYIGQSLRFFCRPNDPDLAGQLNNIVSIEENEIDITLEEIRE